ncbi:MAG TPA: hypothetical protein PK971_13985, partial [Saprospiraceae bacterium]|nr:hypothetical protein [Saprospiraceae bacterium]
GFLSHSSAIFSPHALHRTQKSPRLIQKFTTKNSTNYLCRTLSFYLLFKPAAAKVSGESYQNLEGLLLYQRSSPSRF